MPMQGGGGGPRQGNQQSVGMTAQKAVLKIHLDVAQELSRPVTVHCVGAWGGLWRC